MTTLAVDLLRAERDRKTYELELAKGAVRDLQQAIRSLDDALTVLSGAPPAAPTTRASGNEPLKLIIQRILTDRPGLGPSEITDALNNAGRTADINTVLGTLSRANKEGLIHKSGRVWFAGPSERDVNDVTSESEKAPERSGASQEIGAGDGSQGAASHPSPAGSTPVSSTLVRNDLLSSVSGRSVAQPKPPWQR